MSEQILKPTFKKLKESYKMKQTPKDLVNRIHSNKNQGVFMAYCFGNEYKLLDEYNDVLIYQVKPSRFSELPKGIYHINKNNLRQCVKFEELDKN